MSSMSHQLLSAFALTALLWTTGAQASDQPSAPSGQTGSSDVIVEGQQAKRAGDIPGAIFSPNVIINGQPVITGCTQGTPVFSPSVMINGKPKILDCRQ